MYTHMPSLPPTPNPPPPRNYMSKSSELLLEQMTFHITMATPDNDGCLVPEPVAKVIAAPGHRYKLPYLREKSPPSLDCAPEAYPRALAPMQAPGGCQLVVHRSGNLAGGFSHFVEPAFCLLRPEDIRRRFDFVRGQSYLSFRLRLTNASLLGVVKNGLRGLDDTSEHRAKRVDTIDFMELWSLRLTPRAQMRGLQAGDFKAAADRSDAELRVYCDTGELCWRLL